MAGQVPDGMQSMTKEDLARALGVSTRTIDRLRARGAIPPPVRIGGTLVRWRAKDIVRFLEKLPAR
jgi:predicted DNA-binding transcriptional regulator AlpA